MPELSTTFARFRCAALALLVSLAAPAQAQDRPQVVVVHAALADLATRLGGAAIEVVFPVPEGIDPAFWRPGIADISLMQGADLIVLNGAGFSGWVSKASLPRARMIDTSRGFRDRYIATETVTHSHGDGGEHSHTGTAAFTWLDPALAILQAQSIAQGLAQRDLGDPDAIYTRLADLSAELEALSAAGAALTPLAKGQVLIATHPRYHYLARAFGLEIVALEWEAGAAPSPEQLAALDALVAETGATVLIWEAAPPEAARDAVRALGLSDTVFPTFAEALPDTEFVAGYRAALDDLAAALAGDNG